MVYQFVVLPRGSTAWVFEKLAKNSGTPAVTTSQFAPAAHLSGLVSSLRSCQVLLLLLLTP